MVRQFIGTFNSGHDLKFKTFQLWSFSCVGSKLYVPFLICAVLDLANACILHRGPEQPVWNFTKGLFRCRKAISSMKRLKFFCISDS